MNTNDSFKEKLKEYGEGQLPESERQEMEAELEKVEIYQQYINDMLGASPENHVPLNEKKLVRRGRFKLLWHSLLSTLIILILGYWGLRGIGHFYFSEERLNTAVESTRLALAVTRPNTVLFGPFSWNERQLFSIQQTHGLSRSIGNEFLPSQEFTLNWNLFQQPTFQYPIVNQSHSGFIIDPDSPGAGYVDMFFPNAEIIRRLEQLPVETMGELSISFSERKSMEETFQLLEGRDINLRWMAVHSRIDDNFHIAWGGDAATLGIPHHDWPLGFWEGRRELTPLGDIDLREQDFLWTLNYLKENWFYIENLMPRLQHQGIEATINYIEENGIQIFGIVITAPTSELIAILDEPWVGGAQMGDVTLMNWTPVNP